MIERVVRMREIVKAWEECESCGGTGRKQSEELGNYACYTCLSQCGEWHEAVVGSPCEDENGDVIALGKDFFAVVHKSSTLTRWHEVCSLCDGEREFDNMDILTCDETPFVSCPHCHGTGCEEGTATEWEVE